MDRMRIGSGMFTGYIYIIIIIIIIKREREYNKVQACLGLETFSANFRPYIYIYIYLSIYIYIYIYIWVILLKTGQNYDIEDSNPFFAHDTLAYNDVSPYWVWLQKVHWFIRYCPN